MIAGVGLNQFFPTQTSVVMFSCWMKTLHQAADQNGISATKQKRRQRRHQQVVQHRWQQPLHNSSNNATTYCNKMRNCNFHIDELESDVVPKKDRKKPKIYKYKYKYKPPQAAQMATMLLPSSNTKTQLGRLPINVFTSLVRN